MNNTELESKLAELIAERDEIKANLARVDEWNARLRKLEGGYHSYGEITIARHAIRDSRFPVYDSSHFGKNRRIVAVDSIWIVLRRDGENDSEVEDFRVKDGMKARSIKHGEKIDVEKALAIWKEHQAAKV